MTSEPAPAVRRVATLAEYQECVAIQRETWGADFSECVPATILMVAQKIGGVVAGAFGADGAMLGFVFGMAGVVDGRAVHWSDMLAVRPAARGGHLGERLKWCQRALARAAGAEAMYWTFDPLVARNAHFNLTRLGARVVEYAPNLYGDGTASPLHAGLPTDRLVARWDLLAADRAPDGRPPGGAAPNDAAPNDATPNDATPNVTTDAGPLVVPVADGGAPLAARALPDAGRVQVAIPADFHELPPALRAAWRAGARTALLAYLGRGYQVTGFRRAGDGAPPRYLLEHAPASAPPPPILLPR